MYSEPSETSKVKLFIKNIWLYLSVDYFCKTLHIIFSTGLWKCLDKTKQNSGLLSFISLKIRTAISVNLLLNIFYLHIITLPPWDINHKFKIGVFHFQLIHPSRWIHVILVSHYLPVQTITTVKKSKGNYTVLFY